MHIESIQTYPLTGARGIDTPEANATKHGLMYDRRFVLFDGDTRSRISTKPADFPELHRIAPTSPDGTFLDFCNEDGLSVGRIITPVDGGSLTWIDEFGDRTPVYDQGNSIADKFRNFLKTDRNIRLGEKSRSIMAVNPHDRAVAPYHVTTTASQRYIAEQTGLDELEVMRRFRPNIVVNNDGAEPFEELQWKAFKVGEAVIILHRPTMRCPVPSQDSQTGKNMKDVAKTYPSLPSVENSQGRAKPVFGMYGYLDGVVMKPIRIGQNVEVIT
jgi:uncharacterized protein YcbX